MCERAELHDPASAAGPGPRCSDPCHGLPPGLTASASVPGIGCFGALSPGPLTRPPTLRVAGRPTPRKGWASRAVDSSRGRTCSTCRCLLILLTRFLMPVSRRTRHHPPRPLSLARPVAHPTGVLEMPGQREGGAGGDPEDAPEERGHPLLSDAASTPPAREEEGAASGGTLGSASGTSSGAPSRGRPRSTSLPVVGVACATFAAAGPPASCGDPRRARSVFHDFGRHQRLPRDLPRARPSRRVPAHHTPSHLIAGGSPRATGAAPPLRVPERRPPRPPAPFLGRPRPPRSSLALRRPRSSSSLPARTLPERPRRGCPASPGPGRREPAGNAHRRAAPSVPHPGSAHGSPTAQRAHLSPSPAARRAPPSPRAPARRGPRSASGDLAPRPRSEVRERRRRSQRNAELAPHRATSLRRRRARYAAGHLAP
jgi:hypothetical protein